VRRVRVLLDANVIVDAQVRDLFLRLAEAEVIDVRWSAAILDEVRRALRRRINVSEDKINRLVSTLDDVFPEAAVAGFSDIERTLDLPDPDDRHVLAAAIAGECDVLVTYNDRDFPDEALETADVVVLDPDHALTLLVGWFKDDVVNVAHQQIAALQRPSMSTSDFLDRLVKRAPAAAMAIGAALGDETYGRLFQDTIDATLGNGPQEAVRQLLDAISGRDLVALADLVHPECARRLAGSDAPTTNEVFTALARLLADVFEHDDWGFATAKRIIGPSTERVTLVRGGREVRVSFTPVTAEAGHNLDLQMHDGRWVLFDLDPPEGAS